MFSIFKSKPKEPVKLCFATDIHCHVLPGIDDGSPDVKTSADLVERMQAWGIERVLASPHVTQGTFENTLGTITPAIEALRGELAARGCGIALGHSAEYRIDALLASRIEADDLMPYPNKFLLIENSFIQEPLNLEQLVFDLQLKGYQPILAHPERYNYYYSKRDRYEHLHDIGLMFQINLLSLAGAYKGPERKIALDLIKRRLVDFAGTDLHRHRHADAIDAYLRTRDAASDMDALAPLLHNDTAFT